MLIAGSSGLLAVGLSAADPRCVPGRDGQIADQGSIVGLSGGSAEKEQGLVLRLLGGSAGRELGAARTDSCIQPSVDTSGKIDNDHSNIRRQAEVPETGVEAARISAMGARQVQANCSMMSMMVIGQSNKGMLMMEEIRRDVSRMEDMVDGGEDVEDEDESNEEDEVSLEATSKEDCPVMDTAACSPVVSTAMRALQVQMAASLSRK
ncbi:hypothetical protein NE237_018284 [Protea cynaroides]|uniref:Uncharacterized protein n=1 Tax=Protea cynaroides TaxID=273540 RepID=A0A9Q0QNV1_9MAGN|nr:hypothetical protein NE237_018284 [Protea cynaroides]